MKEVRGSQRPRFNNNDENQGGGIANGEVWFKESFMLDPWDHLE